MPDLLQVVELQTADEQHLFFAILAICQVAYECIETCYTLAQAYNHKAHKGINDDNMRTFVVTAVKFARDILDELFNSTYTELATPFFNMMETEILTRAKNLN